LAIYDRADLHSRLLEALARPATDAELPSLGARADLLLSDAQLDVALRLALEVPETNYTTITFTTSDSKVYSPATAGQEWIGEIEVYRDATIKGPPMSLGAYWDCSKDWAIETPRSIRLTCGRTKAYPALTGRIFSRPGVIDGSTPPVLKPASLLRAVVQLAAAKFCMRGAKRDPGPFLAQYEDIYTKEVTALRPNLSSGTRGGAGWWNVTGDLGRLG
jgi:hypothetical protein